MDIASYLSSAPTKLNLSAWIELGRGRRRTALPRIERIEVTPEKDKEHKE